MKKYLIILSFLFVCLAIHAQLSTDEEPISFGRSLEMDSKLQIDTRTMPTLDMDAIAKEDLEDEEYDYPPRFGYSHKVDLNLQNSGTWQVLSNGDKLWQLSISCPSALSINLLYDKFWIPEGGKMFIYTPDKKQYIGAFTYKNNKGDRKDIQGFATGLLYGDKIIIEYYQPKEIKNDAVISIAYVVHGYRYIKLPNRYLGSSGECQVNVNCSEGDNWQKEKRAVALILVNGNRYCTGSLVRSTSNDFRPLLLTADHCLGGWANEDYTGESGYKYDAINSPNLNHWTFWWNYEAPGCSNINYEPGKYTTSGATVLANNSYSDFALLELSEDPLSITNYIPYYLGWDNSGNSGTGGVGIHHPSGDVKKISTYSIRPISSQYGRYEEDDEESHWRVNWFQTAHGYGTTEGGSSGSPLINNSHRVIGQLHGSNTSCSNLLGSSWYGKFSVSWTGNGASDNRRKLNHWLNPFGGVTTTDGSFPFSISGPSIICTSATYSITNIKASCSVIWSFKNASSFNSIIQQDTPTTNQCTITPGNSTINNTLVATIWHNGSILCTLEKDIITPLPLNGTIHQEGRYYHGINYPSFTVAMDPLFPMNQACQVTLQSPKFKNMNFSTYTNPNTSVSLQRIDDETIKLEVPFRNSDVTLYIYGTGDESCNDFELRTVALRYPIDMSNAVYANISGNRIELELNQAIMHSWIDNENINGVEQKPYKLAIYEATTGRLMYSTETGEKKVSIDTPDWNTGVYIINVVANGKTYSTKVTIK